MDSLLRESLEADPIHGAFFAGFGGSISRAFTQLRGSPRSCRKTELSFESGLRVGTQVLCCPWMILCFLGGVSLASRLWTPIYTCRSSFARPCARARMSRNASQRSDVALSKSRLCSGYSFDVHVQAVSAVLRCVFESDSARTRGDQWRFDFLSVFAAYPPPWRTDARLCSPCRCASEAGTKR